MRKLLFSILLLAAAPAAMAERPAFAEQYGGNLSIILASATASDVVDISTGGYRLYFTTGSYYVQSATSTDGSNWTVESGMRLSTSAALDISSITSVAVYHNSTISSTGTYIAYYVGVNATGKYSILRAYSSDGLNFVKDSSFYHQYNGGSTYIGSLKAWPIDNNNMLLYHIYDSAGLNSSGTYRAAYLASSDKGATLPSTTTLLSGTTVYALAVSSITGGTVRMFTAGPPSGSTYGYQITSWLSGDHGRGFSGENGIRYSTTSTVNITAMAVMRDAAAWRWRLMPTFGVLNATGTVHDLLTVLPAIESVVPNKVYQTDPNVTLTVNGEIFSSSGALTATLSSTAGNNITVLSVTRASDVLVTISAATNGSAIDTYTLNITDTDNYSGTYPGALQVDFKPGTVDMMDNVFRPLNNEKCRGDATVYADGRLTVNVYTSNGKKVRAVYDAPINPGSQTVLWDGRTDSGNVAASGMYLMEFKGPKLDYVAKVVLIK